MFKTLTRGYIWHEYGSFRRRVKVFSYGMDESVLTVYVQWFIPYSGTI
jgi:hypothetical protein